MGIKTKKTLKGQNLKRLALALVMTTALSLPALANVTPKALSVVDHSDIVVSDVFSGVTGPDAGHYLAPAPQPGEQMTLSSYDLTRISDAFDLGWTANGPGQEVVIRRASNDITRFDIEAVLAQKMQSETAGTRFKMSLDNQSAGFHVAKGAVKTLKIESFSYDPAAGTFRATVAATANGEEQTVTGHYCAIERIPVLNTPLNAGDVITRADISYVDMLSTDVSSSMITSPASLIGRTPRFGLPAMRPVATNAVKMPIIIKRGELVTMVLSSPLMHLTAMGRAMQSGAVGDAINVMNPSSKQIIAAVVTGPQTVSVQSPLSAVPGTM